MEQDVTAELILSPADSRTLIACENVISQGLKTFYEVGCALAQIRDQRLYRLTHGTFEEYTRERWGLAARTANQRISAARMTDLLKDTGAVPPNEAIARALAETDVATARSAWIQALSEDGTITAEKIRKLVMREKHATQEIAPVAAVTCPNCGHRHAPWRPETASRGSRNPSRGLAWALREVGPIASAVDYGCGRFRNAELIEQHCANVVYVDTEEQCSRVGVLANGRNLLTTSAIKGQWDCVISICVLHILPLAMRQRCAQTMMALQPRLLIVEVPRYQQFYSRLRTRREAGYYFKLQDSDVIALFDDYRISNAMLTNNNRTLILERNCAD